MTAEEWYEFSEEDEEIEEPDDLAGHMVVLRDIMRSYDLSFVMDVRDSAFMARLEEAVRMLGMGLTLHAGSATQMDDGLFESTCVLRISYGSESEEHMYRAVSTDPAIATLLSARGALSDASLLNTPEFRGDGHRVDIEIPCSA